jgi:hypothetical protein
MSIAAERMKKEVRMTIETIVKKIKGGVIDEELMALVRMVPVATLEVDHAYQPALSQRRATNIAAAFDPKLFHAITINIRSDGNRYVIDGQHRLAAALLAGRDSVPAWVFQDLSQAEEAQMFERLATQRRSNLVSVHLYRAHLVSGDPTVLALQAVLDEFDLHVDRHSGQRQAHNIASVKALYWIWERTAPFQESSLRQALSVILTAFPSDRDRWSSPLLASVAEFFRAYPSASEDRLIKALKQYSAQKCIVMIREYHQAVGRYVKQFSVHRNRPAEMVEAGVAILRREYNRNLRSDSKLLLE